MAHISSEIQDGPPKGESTGSETSIRSYWYDYTTGDSVLRSMIEEHAFQPLAEDLVIKRPHYTYSVSETDDVNDFLSLTFPQKLWNIVESDQFESIWWDETGTCRVINEELFRKEVLERKEPFRKFETKSKKRLIRQLNLYGVNKNRQTVQRSAALPVFLEEENNISLLRKPPVATPGEDATLFRVEAGEDSEAQVDGVVAGIRRGFQLLAEDITEDVEVVPDE
ncbi:hypothetical protein MG293_020862 [Ovis ammon polii]|uniref:HSF-type DNA-binding domain-containing protein n=1 Tax=Ovis ammon polii TaxID=230172 RepID=A0AAD4TJ90_OVIAM|nr:hypothetical protein MG293_020862 [Ovis ammon polii]